MIEGYRDDTRSNEERRAFDMRGAHYGLDMGKSRNTCSVFPKTQPLYNKIMLFKSQFHQDIANGTITATVRRWKRRQAKVGGRYRIASIGHIEITSVEQVEDANLTVADARRSGFLSLPEMNDYLNSVSTDGDLYRIAFRFIGQLEDTTDRSAIASADEREKASRALDLRDKNSKVGSWTRATLKMVAENPATGSAILANKLGREQAELKRDMRKLKSLGLTISLEVGYRLSAKGQSVVDQKI